MILLGIHESGFILCGLGGVGGVGCMEIGRILFSVGTNNGEIELSVCWIGFSCVVFQFASVFSVC